MPQRINHPDDDAAPARAGAARLRALAAFARHWLRRGALLSSHFSLKLLMLTLCGIALVSGCTGANRQVSLDTTEKYRADTEEMMPIPYTPRDDGLPLSPDELYAFKTVSDLDRHLTEAEARIVELHFKYFVHQKRDTFERFLRRSSRFLPYVKKTFADRGIPEDIAYLFMVESGGNPFARSPAGAVGLWQFMPYTGKKYGLYQSNWVDERRDPYKATLAAADYLLKLYNDFSNWHLAAAAYNAGEGKIGRAVSGTGATDFFDLCRLDGQLNEKARLKDETRDYVPRLIAVAKIMRNLKRLGFTEPSPEMAWDLTPMNVPPGTDLAGLSRQLGLGWSEFSGMNPAYLRNVSPPAATSTAYVPPDMLSDAVRWAATSEARMYAGWKEYTVRRGDTLASIAKRNKVSVDSLRQANSFQNLPKHGTAILIPGTVGPTAPPAYRAAAQERSAKSSPPPARQQPVAASRYYKVAQGDTLYSLALKWGTDVASIRQANRMGPKETALKLGKRMIIPGNSKVAPAPKPAPKAPVKTSSQTPADAKPAAAAPPQPVPQQPVPQQELPALSLQPYSPETAPSSGGEADALPSAYTPPSPSATPLPGAAASYGNGIPEAYSPPAAPASAAAPEKKSSGSVKVTKGDTLFSIARARGVSVEELRKANGLGKDDTLKIGQTLVLP